MWGALRGSNPSPPVPQTSALPNELKAPYAMTIRRRSKPSSVRDGHLSQPKGLATSSPPWLLSTSDLGEQPASGRIGDCCGEDCPFQPEPKTRDREWFLLLSRRSVPLWTVNANESRRPGFHQAPLLCAARTFLWRPKRDPAAILNSLSCNSHVNVLGSLRIRCRGGDSNSHGVTPTTP